MSKYKVSLFSPTVGSLVSSLINGNYPEFKTGRTSQGRKRTTTAAQQKRDKVKRKNKVRG